MADRIRVGISILQVRALARIRIGENNLRASLQRAADGFHERIGRLDRHIDGAFRVAFIGISDGGYLRQPRHRAQELRFESDGQFQCDHLRPVPQDRRRTSMANSSRPGTTGK